MILGRKRKAARSALQPAGLVLVSVQEIDEEILRNPKLSDVRQMATHVRAELLSLQIDSSQLAGPAVPLNAFFF